MGPSSRDPEPLLPCSEREGERERERERGKKRGRESERERERKRERERERERERGTPQTSESKAQVTRHASSASISNESYGSGRAS